jgi:hypothetical protein
MRLSTNDIRHKGIYEFELHVGLDLYPDVKKLTVPFTVTIGSCDVSSFEAPSPVSMFYELGNTAA